MMSDRWKMKFDNDEQNNIDFHWKFENDKVMNFHSSTS